MKVQIELLGAQDTCQYRSLRALNGRLSNLLQLPVELALRSLKDDVVSRHLQN